MLQLDMHQAALKCYRQQLLLFVPVDNHRHLPYILFSVKLSVKVYKNSELYHFYFYNNVGTHVIFISLDCYCFLKMFKLN